MNLKRIIASFQGISLHHRPLENKVCNAQIECMHEKKSTSG